MVFSAPTTSCRTSCSCSASSPTLTRIVKPGRVYLGVGPEQNFTYIAAIKPAMAFIIDVRRGNLQLHLMYKALFELSADRADFVSRLFSLKRPAGLDRKSSVQSIFTAYTDPRLRSPELYKQNVSAIRRLLLEKSEMGLSAGGSQGHRRDLPGVLRARARHPLRGARREARDRFPPTPS